MEKVGTKILLIDLENCPNQIHQLRDDLEKYTQVIICYAQTGAKIPLDWMMPLTVTINTNRLKLLKMPSVGKNAADFGIAFWAGILMTQLPPETHFDIVSNDTDLDYVVHLLISQQRSAKRIGITKTTKVFLPTVEKQNLPYNESPFDEPPFDESPFYDDYLQEACSFILTRYSGRPTNKKALINSLKAHFKRKTKGLDINELFEQLLDNAVIEMANNNALIYNESTLNTIAYSCEVPF